MRAPPLLLIPPWLGAPRTADWRERLRYEARRMWRDQRGILAIPGSPAIRYQHNLGNVGATTIGTSCTTGGAASTKGTPAELITTTNFDAFWVRVIASGYGNAATTSRGCLDILAGAATEDVLIPDLLMGFCGGVGTTLGAGAKVWDFPLYVPSGTRIAAQVAGDRTATAMRVGIILYGGSISPWFPVGGSVTTYGIGTVPAGTTVTSGASGAEGSWIQITASTSLDHFAWIPSFQPPSGDTTLTPVKNFWMDIGSGAATEEQMVGDQNSWIFRYESGELCEGPFNPMPVFQQVPSGTRIVARLSASGALDAASPECALHAMAA